MTSDFLEEYLEDAKDHIATFEKALLRLEQNIEDSEALKNIFRASHSLKGSSYYMGFGNFGSVVHNVENILEPLIKENKVPSRNVVDLLFKVLEFLEGGIDFIAKTGSDPEVPPELAELTVPPPLPENEEQEIVSPITDEEYDEELLSIYVETVEEKLKELLELLAHYEHQEELTSKIREIFERLVSASRYMDFDPLVELFELWQSDLEKIVGKTDFIHSATSLCEDNLQKLKKLVPRIHDDALFALIRKVSSESEPESVADDIAEDIVDDLDSLTQQIDSVFDDLEYGAAEEEQEAILEVPEDLTDSGDVFSPPEEQKVPEVQEKETLPFVTIEEEKIAEEIEDSEPDIVPSQLLRVDPAKVDHLLDKVGELVIRRSEFDVTTSELKEIIDTWSREGRIGKEEKKILEGLYQKYSDSLTFLGRLTRELQDSVMKIRMLPLMQLFSRFPRAVREHARELGKDVQLVVHGGDTELDRHLLEQLYEPLLHILRNAVFHGIETPEERVASGKPSKGTITINAYYKHQMVFIEIQDDGRGVDLENLKSVLVAQGIYSPEEVKNLDEEKLLNSIFIAGVSTSPESTESAGRGMGLDIARQKCRAINGQITVQTIPGHGTKFTVQIPLTLAIIPALLVLISNQTYVLPLASVSEVYDYDRSKIKKIRDSYVFTVKNKTIPLVFPEDIFPRLEMVTDEQDRYIVLLNTPFHEVGLVVDRFLGQQEIVIKPIEDLMHAIHGYTGATILGDGSLSLILDVSDLMSIAAAKNKHLSG